MGTRGSHRGPEVDAASIFDRFWAPAGRSEGHPGPPFRMPGGDRNAQRGIEKAESVRRVATAPEVGLPGRDQTPRDPCKCDENVGRNGSAARGPLSRICSKKGPPGSPNGAFGGRFGDPRPRKEGPGRSRTVSGPSPDLHRILVTFWVIWRSNKPDEVPTKYPTKYPTNPPPPPTPAEPPRRTPQS